MPRCVNGREGTHRCVQVLLRTPLRESPELLWGRADTLCTRLASELHQVAVSDPRFDVLMIRASLADIAPLVFTIGQAAARFTPGGFAFAAPFAGWLENHRRCGMILRIVSLTDRQLAAIMDAARPLPVEKRDVYLQRIAAMLALRGRGHYDDSDVTDVAKLAVIGLAQQPVA